MGAVTVETSDTKTIRLDWPLNYEVSFKTGQFITCFWPDEPTYKRAYSLSSSAIDRGFYEFTVRRDGRMGTRMVDGIEAGQRLMVLPPTGRFLPVYEPNLHLICIAGGSGVAPFRGFVREATGRQLATRITVLYSVRTPADIIFVDEFGQLQKDNPHFRFQVTCTRLSASDPWSGRRGRIEAAWISEQITELDSTMFYACGPDPFVESVQALAVELGVPKIRMLTEKWG